MSLFKLSTIAFIAVVMASCAKSADNIEASYVSPLNYQGYSCSQIAGEMKRISERAKKLAGVVDDNATNDGVATAVAVVIFLPAAFFIKGNGPEAVEYAKLKGEIDTLEKVAKKKGCRIKIARKKKTETS